MEQKKRAKANVACHSVLIAMLLLGNCWMITLASSPSTGTNSRQCQQPVCYYFEEIPSLQEFTTWKREVMDIVKEENLKEYLTDWLQDIDTIEEILISLEKPKKQAHEEKEEEQKKPKEKTNKFAALLKQYQVKKSIFSFAPVNQKGKLITIGSYSQAHLVSKSPLIALLDELFRESYRTSESFKWAERMKRCWEISAKYLGKTHPMTKSMKSCTTTLATQDAQDTSHSRRISCKYFEEIPSLTHFTIWKEYVMRIANKYRLERFLRSWLEDIQTIAKIIESLENEVTEEQANEDEENEVKEEENEENEEKEEVEKQKHKGGKKKKKTNKFAALIAQYQVKEQGVMDILLGRPNPVAKKYQLAIIGKTTPADRISVDAAIAVLDEISREISRSYPVFKTMWKLSDLRAQIALKELQEQHKLTQMLTFNPFKALKNVITKKSLPVNVHKKND